MDLDFSLENEHVSIPDLILCMLGDFSCFCFRLLTFFSSKISFMNAISMSNGLDPE